MAVPSRFKNGVNGEIPGTVFANLPVPSPVYIIFEKEEFVKFDTTTWTLSGTSGAVATAVGGAGGNVTVNATGVTASTAWISDTTSFISFTTAQQVWYEADITITTAATNAMQFGLQSTAVASPSAGLYFSKAAGSASITFNMTNAAATTQNTLITTVVSGTKVKLGFYYNGKDAVDIFVDGAKVASQSTLTNLPLSKRLLRTVGVTSTAAAQADITLDYILVAQDRT